MSKDLAVIESKEGQDSYLVKLQADITMLSGYIETFSDESAKLKREMTQDQRHKTLTKIKKQIKQLSAIKHSLVSEFNGVQKFVLESYMPGESLFNKTMALVENTLGKEKPLQLEASASVESRKSKVKSGVKS